MTDSAKSVLIPGESRPAGPKPADDPREAARAAISDGIAALERLYDSLDASFDAAASELINLEGKVVTLGVGKSGHAAQKVAATLRSVGLPALYLNASDSLHGDLGVLDSSDVGMLFSKSGSTRELMVLVPHLRARCGALIGVFGTPGSPLGEKVDIVLDASVEKEGCALDAAPMASVLAAQALGDALAATVTRARGFTSDDFARLHPAGALGARLTLTVADVMRRGNDLPLVGVDSSFKDAVIEITRTASGAVCVVDAAQRLKGFLTDGDIRRGLLRFEDVAAVGVAEVMTREPFTVTPELPLSQALLAFEQRPRAYNAAPVVEGETCVGLLLVHDAVQAHLPD